MRRNEILLFISCLLLFLNKNWIIIPVQASEKKVGEAR